MGAGTRQAFLDANLAGRAAIERAVAAKCPAGAKNVLLGVIYMLSLYSRTSDHVGLAQIADAVGLTGPSGVRQVGRHLRTLHDAGVLIYQPGRGEGHHGFIRLPEVARTAPVLDPPEVARGAPVLESEMSEEVARTVPRSGAQRATYRGFTEKPSGESAPPTRGESDELFDALMAACGVNPSEIPRRKEPVYRGAARDLRNLDVRPTSDEIHRRAAEFRRRWSQPGRLTPLSLVDHWAELGPPPDPPSAPVLPDCDDCGNTRWLLDEDGNVQARCHCFRLQAVS